MSTVTDNLPASIVNFHGQELLAIKDNDGNVFVAMKPIVEGMGLSWGSQFTKLRQNKEKFGCFDIKTVAEDGKNREVVCIPLNKLNAWLFSVNPEKVRKDLRPGIILYQEECAFVLYDYWHKGEVVNPRAVAAKPARPKAVKADKLVKITRNVLAAEVKAGVRAVCKSMGRDPAVGDYNIAYRNARVACHVFRWAQITNDVAAENLAFLRGKVDEQLKVYEKCKGCTKVVMDWRPISPDGKHVIVQAVVKEELPAAEPKELPRVTTGAERKPLAIAVNQMIGANDEGPTRQKYMQFWRALNAVLGLNSIEELTADRLPAVQKLVELIASMVATPATTPLPGALPGDFAALAPADQVSVLLDAYEKTVEFAQANAWAVEAKLLEVIKRVDIGPGMDHMQGMQVRQMINDLRIGFVHAMQPIQASLNAVRPLFWMLAAASKLGQRNMAMLPN